MKERFDWWTTAVYLAVSVALSSATFQGVPGDYCRIKPGNSCCPNRDDDCVMPIVNTLCYCDMFCDRYDGEDCCPDFKRVCRGEIGPPPAPLTQHCLHEGIHYRRGESLQNNCNKCVCHQVSVYPERHEFQCENNVCLIRPEIIDGVNHGNLGWTASNYSFLWGKTLHDGITYRLGTLAPQQDLISMTELNIEVNDLLPPNFDARIQWPNMIQPIRDQGDCGSSWAFSTAAVASDRIAIVSKGQDKVNLSPQHLLSCNHRKQQGCDGGHLDRAWWYLRKRGVVTEECYPYHSGVDHKRGKCDINIYATPDAHIRCPSGHGIGAIYKMTPPYKVASSEREIMKEIMDNGPVQATFHVREDFYMYAGGVYQYSRIAQNYPPEYRQTGYHSVRILGWGVDTSTGRSIPYWLCANTWGTQWGEGGYFRIRRGTNEVQIESLIIGVWGKPTNRDSRYRGRDRSLHRIRHHRSPRRSHPYNKRGSTT